MLVATNQPMVKLVSLYTVMLKVAKPLTVLSEDLLYYAMHFTILQLINSI